MRTEYTDTAAALLQWFKKKGFVPGTRVPSSRALSAKVGCTLSTTNRACLWLIAQGKLRRDGQKLFLGHALLPTGTRASHPIYVVSAHTGFLRACARMLNQRGYDCSPVEVRLTEIADIIRKVMDLEHRPRAGMIVAPWINDQKTVNGLRSLRGPLVLCNDLDWDEDFNVVGVDLQRGVEKALRHLITQGHHEVAHVSCNRKDSADQKLATVYRNGCLSLGLRSSASRIWQADGAHLKLLKNLMVSKRREHPEVTALFGDDRVGMVATEVFSIPAELSVIGCYDLEEAAKTKPPLTTIQLQDPGGLAFWCCSEIINQIEGQSDPLHSPIKRQVKVAPNLIVRGSTKSLRAPPQPDRPRSRPERILGSWEHVYPFIKKQARPVWNQIDLRPFANHSLTRPHGWLGGLPLLNLMPGIRSIHGVPFQIIDESLNEGRAAITFASPRTHTARERLLPTRMKIPIQSSAKAVYFLHGCGWAERIELGSYTVHLRNGKKEVVKLVPMGPSVAPLSKREKPLGPNLQDWWPEYEQAQFPHAHAALITDPSHPDRYERYIYSLECILEKGREIQAIEINVDPEAGPTLALLAISTLEYV